MPKFAKGSKINCYKTREQLEKCLKGYGCEVVVTNDANGKGTLFVGWTFGGLPYRFEIPMPDRKDYERTEVTGDLRSQELTDKFHEQAARQYWRLAKEYIYMHMEFLEVTGCEFHEAFAPLLVTKSGDNVWQLAAVKAREIGKEGGDLLALMGPKE
ncbi:hypothetical protein LCGC14_1347110 [marine sediment metagenome]|uniref:Uncharacterized protein n=1 Tax=marine sediment metagenome TaxID=412755 RepID=A0A0F9KC22_9ZZZZ